MKNFLREVNYQAMTEAQLIKAVTGVTNKIPYNLQYLSECSPAELAQWFTPLQVNRLKSAMEMATRLHVKRDMFQIRSPDDAAQYITPYYSNAEQECLVVMCLNTKNFVVSMVELYRGSVNTGLVRNAEVFKEAIRLNSPAIIIAHNHPSGDPSPSADDIQTTRSIVEAGKVLDIDVLDHVIIGNNSWISLRQRGLL